MSKLKILLAKREDKEQISLIGRNVDRLPTSVFDWYNSEYEDDKSQFEVNEMIFFVEDDIINGIGYINGYLNLETFIDSDKTKKEMVEKSTDYVFNTLNMDTVNFIVKNKDKDLMSFMINSNYELIDNTNDFNTFVKDNPKGL